VSDPSTPDAEPGPFEPAPKAKSSPPPSARRLVPVLIVFVLVTAGYFWAFQPSVAGTPEFLWRFALPHALLGVLAVRELSRDGVLFERLKPRWGDLSLGAIAAMLLLVASWFVRAKLAPPGSDSQQWLLFLYVMLGDPEQIQRSIVLTSLLLGITLAEEIVWRGLVTHRLTEHFGVRRGWLFAVALYCLAALPTAFTLRAPAGPNPLLLFATLGCGIVWTYLAVRVGRLVPGIFSHMAFTYFSVLQFRIPT
jgi:membrane protease YdiL (CAAX protease family)